MITVELARQGAMVLLQVTVDITWLAVVLLCCYVAGATGVHARRG